MCCLADQPGKATVISLCRWADVSHSPEAACGDQFRVSSIPLIHQAGNLRELITFSIVFVICMTFID